MPSNTLLTKASENSRLMEKNTNILFKRRRKLNEDC